MNDKSLSRSQTLLRVTGLILSSGLFFPVSCTTGAAVGTHAISNLNARDVAGGEAPHALFHVLVRGPGDSPAISVTGVDESGRVGPLRDGHTFLLDKTEGEFTEGEWIRYRYRVEPLDGGRQHVEVRYSDDDRSAVSRYIAGQNDIRALYSRILVPGYMFGAFPYAFGFALILWLLGKIMLWRVKVSQDPWPGPLDG